VETLIVVDRPEKWPLNVPGIAVVAARDYLTKPGFRQMSRAKVFNLCKSYKYQTNGYYVSLLAEARGHKPIPSVPTIQDMRSQVIVRQVSSELDELIQKSLADIRGSDFVLSIYFGKNLAKRYDRLSGHLFRYFHAPFIRAHFIFGKTWQLVNIGPISSNLIPEEHRPFVIKAATDYLAGRVARAPKKSESRFDLAILYGGDETPPSNEKAIQKFSKACEAVGIATEIIHKDDYNRLSEFDALWIRETTSVNHYTYRFARRATAEGLVVIDDPVSIVKCTNKVYLTELMHHHRIRIPRTLIVHRDNVDEVASAIGFPCILKQPDSSFSQGVKKAQSYDELVTISEMLFEKTDLFLAQEFVPTPYDWRIGILDKNAIFAAKYHMAKSHWQITRHTDSGKMVDGRVESVPLDKVPESVVKTALRSCALIGNGLYGVDLKLLEEEVYVIEVNDNPNIDAGYEDQVLKDSLYDILAGDFLRRIEQRKQKRSPGHESHK